MSLGSKLALPSRGHKFYMGLYRENLEIFLYLIIIKAIGYQVMQLALSSGLSPEVGKLLP